MLSPFVKRNKPLCLEVYQLQESGYLLAPYQSDLTPIQKLFLVLAAPVYHREVERVMREREKQQERERKHPGLVTDPGFEDRTRKQILNKRRKREGIDEQHLRGSLKPG